MRHAIGWVAARDGQYSDALRKHHRVTLLAAETSGALAPDFDRLLRVYGRAAARPSAKDSTVYGLSPSSPQRFYGHHTAAISAAIAFADAVTVVNEAARIQHSRQHAHAGLNARP